MAGIKRRGPDRRPGPPPVALAPQSPRCRNGAAVSHRRCAGSPASPGSPAPSDRASPRPDALESSSNRPRRFRPGSRKDPARAPTARARLAIYALPKRSDGFPTADGQARSVTRGDPSVGGVQQAKGAGPLPAGAPDCAIDRGVMRREHARSPYRGGRAAAQRTSFFRAGDHSPFASPPGPWTLVVPWPSPRSSPTPVRPWPA